MAERVNWTDELEEFMTPEMFRQFKGGDFIEVQPLAVSSNSQDLAVEEEFVLPVVTNTVSEHCLIMGCTCATGECRECKVNYLRGNAPKEKKSQEPRVRKIG